MTEWRIYRRSYVDHRIGVKCEVDAFLRGDDLPVVTANRRSPGCGWNERTRPMTAVRNPTEIHVTFAWRSEAWVPLTVELSGPNLRNEAQDVTVSVDWTVPSTPEPIRAFVTWATPTERPGSWVGHDADHGFYGREEI